MDAYKNNVAKLVNALKGMTWKTTLYPALVSIFAITIVILFIMSTRFISKNINRVFVSEEDAVSGLTRLDTVNYLPVAEKLGIPTESPDVAKKAEVPKETTLPTEATNTITETASTVIDKTSLKIAVYNGTNTAGLAGELKKSLESAGFSVKTSGNKTGDYPYTIIEIKESAQSALGDIESIVGREYQPTVRNISADAPYDIVIIIGAK